MQRRLRKLKEAFESDKIRISSHIAEGFEESLAKVRYKENGEVDLNTVDGRIRSMALAITAMSDREELKEKNPLKDIQGLYFKYVERNFGQFHEIMKQRGLTPHEAGLAAKNSSSSIEEIVSIAPKFTDSILELWTHVNDPCKYHLEDLNALKGIYGGDISPSYDHNIASSCGIYLDTILLPDPFLRMRPLLDRWSPADCAYYFMKHAMILMNYKDLAIADLEHPIIAVVPDDMLLDEERMKINWKLAEQDAAKLGEIIFDEGFSSFEELRDFTHKLDTVDKLISAIKNPRKILFDTEWKGSLEEQIVRSLKESYGKVGWEVLPGEMISMHCVSRMAQSNDALFRSHRFRGTPLMDAPTSWKHFQWKLELDASSAFGVASSNSQVSAGLLNAAQGEMSWLGNISTEALLEIRQNGAIHEIRDILKTGVSDLENMSAEAFESGSQTAINNLRNAFSSHEKLIEDLKGRFRDFAIKDVGSWVAIGTVEIAAAGTGLPLFGIAGLLANQVLDVPKIKELIPKAREIKKEMDERKRSPVGLLFAHKT